MPEPGRTETPDERVRRLREAFAEVDAADAAYTRARLAEEAAGRGQSEVEAALRYISSPTMGLPGGRDALDFVDEASEVNARAALKACIRTARQALAKVCTCTPPEMVHRTGCPVSAAARCPWPCDDDCPELCHEVHLVKAKRTHEREDCPAVSADASRFEGGFESDDTLAVGSKQTADDAGPVSPPS